MKPEDESIDSTREIVKSERESEVCGSLSETSTFRTLLLDELLLDPPARQFELPAFELVECLRWHTEALCPTIPQALHFILLTVYLQFERR